MPRKPITEILREVTEQLERETPEEREARHRAQIPGDLVCEWLIQKEDERQARESGTPIPTLRLHTFVTRLYHHYGQEVAHEVVELILLHHQMTDYESLEPEV